jgi:amidase
VVEWTWTNEFWRFWNHTYCRHESRSPNYLNTYANEVTSRSIAEIVAYNNNDAALKSLWSRPFWWYVIRQNYWRISSNKAKVRKAGVQFWNTNGKIPTRRYLSINNNNSGLCVYYCLTIPMGYKTTGEPWGLTFYSQTLSRRCPFNGFCLWKATKTRKLPNDYK